MQKEETKTVYEPEGVDDSKETASSRHWFTEKLTEEWGSMQKSTQTNVTQSPITESERVHTIQPLTKKLSADKQKINQPSSLEGINLNKILIHKNNDL